MCLLQQDDECGYNVTEVLHISAEGTAFLGENYEGRWIGWNWLLAGPLNRIRFLSVGQYEVGVHHAGNQEGRHQSVEAMKDATVGSSCGNMLRHDDWYFIAREQCDGGRLEHALEWPWNFTVAMGAKGDNKGELTINLLSYTKSYCVTGYGVATVVYKVLLLRRTCRTAPEVWQLGRGTRRIKGLCLAHPVLCPKTS